MEKFINNTTNKKSIYGILQSSMPIQQNEIDIKLCESNKRLLYGDNQVEKVCGLIFENPQSESNGHTCFNFNKKQKKKKNRKSSFIENIKKNNNNINGGDYPANIVNNNSGNQDLQKSDSNNFPESLKKNNLTPTINCKYEMTKLNDFSLNNGNSGILNTSNSVNFISKSNSNDLFTRNIVNAPQNFMNNGYVNNPNVNNKLSIMSPINNFSCNNSNNVYPSQTEPQQPFYNQNAFFNQIPLNNNPFFCNQNNQFYLNNQFGMMNPLNPPINSPNHQPINYSHTFSPKNKFNEVGYATSYHKTHGNLTNFKPDFYKSNHLHVSQPMMTPVFHDKLTHDIMEYANNVEYIVNKLKPTKLKVLKILEKIIRETVGKGNIIIKNIILKKKF